MAKKKKRSAGELHRQVQDSIQALPYVIDQERKQGHRARAFVLSYVSGPMLRMINRVLGAKRYRGKEGEKLKQTEQMRRHLEQKQAAMRHVQSTLQKQQKSKRGPAR